MRKSQRIIKRLVDVVAASVGLLFVGWLILVASLIARWDTGLSGLFYQKRIGLKGRPFYLIKIRSMRHIPDYTSTVTADSDPRITPWGRFFRKTKIDELPQLINVLRGQMSLVGPRPDVPGYADLLEGDDRVILNIRPGITGPASIYFRNEEELLEEQKDPEKYNRDVIWPKKIELNREYIVNYSLSRDLYYIIKTIF